jgi:hypothetical protein
VTNPRGQRLVAVAASALLVLASLGGCALLLPHRVDPPLTASPTPSAPAGQSIETACKLLSNPVLALQNDLPSIESQLGTDPSGGQSLFTQDRAAFDAASAKVSNADVQQAVQPLGDMFDRLSGELAAITQNNPNVDPDQVYSDFDDTLTALGVIADSCGISGSGGGGGGGGSDQGGDGGQGA